MKRPENVGPYDFMDTIQAPDGYDLKSIPDITRDNIQTLIDKHNELVEVINMLCDKSGISFDK